MSGVGGVGTASPVARLDITGTYGSGGPTPTEILTPPVGQDGNPAPSSAVPSLPMPNLLDANVLMDKLLALKIKMSDAQIKTAMDNIKGDATLRKDKATETAEKTAEAAEKQKEASKNALAMKILGWVAVALTVVAAIAISVASFGTATAVAAVVCAMVIVTMATLNETGQMDKMQEAIKDSLVNDWGMDPAEAQKAAIGLNMAIQLSVAIICCVATVGAGASSSVSTIIQVSSGIAKIARAVSYGAEAANAGVTISQQGMAIDSAVKSRDATLLQADALDLKALLMKLQHSQDDEQDRLQTMVQQAAEVISRAMKILAGQADSSSGIIQHMG